MAEPVAQTQVVDVSSRPNCAIGFIGIIITPCSYLRSLVCMVCIETAGAATGDREDWSCPTPGVSCSPSPVVSGMLGLGESVGPQLLMCEGTALLEDEVCPWLAWGFTHHRNG